MAIYGWQRSREPNPNRPSNGETVQICTEQESLGGGDLQSQLPSALLNPPRKLTFPGTERFSLGAPWRTSSQARIWKGAPSQDSGRGGVLFHPETGKHKYVSFMYSIGTWLLGIAMPPPPHRRRWPQSACWRQPVIAGIQALPSAPPKG